MQVLTEQYKNEGYAALRSLEKERFIQDSKFLERLIPLIVERDDQEAFSLLLHKIWWGGYYKVLCRASLNHNTTKYLEKLITVSGTMLADEIEMEDCYSDDELRIVVEAYLKTEWSHVVQESERLKSYL